MSAVPYARLPGMRCIASQSIVPASAEKTPHTPSAKVAGAQPHPRAHDVVDHEHQRAERADRRAAPTDWTRARIGRESEAPSPSSPSMPAHAAARRGVGVPELGAARPCVGAAALRGSRLGFTAPISGKNNVDEIVDGLQPDEPIPSALPK